MKNSLALADFVPTGQKTSVALGFFDGYHLGHQAILKATCDSPLRPVTLTFRNHPAGVVASDRKPGLLTTANERFEWLHQAGTEVVWVDFDRPFSQLTAQEFFEQILVARLGAGRLVSGGNYRFGHKAQGDVDLLRSLSEPLGIEVVTVPGVQDEGEWISSTRIRECVSQGRMQDAQRMLGRPFSIANRVVRGDQRGRLLQFPTANLLLQVEKLVPAYGVYACWVRRHGEGERLPAVANLGVRPTVTTSNEALLEVHLIDFDADLYGERLVVELVNHLRPEQRFAGLDELKAQIAKDRDRARELLR